MSEYPGAYLVRWCYNLPQDYGLSLAHLYLILTAQDMAPMFLEGEGIWREFNARMTKEDVPVRMAARCIAAVSIFGFLLDCLTQGQDGLSRSFPQGMGMGHIAPSLRGSEVWADIARSCRELSEQLCGAEQVARWLAEVLNGDGAGSR